jgi:hypothetical protein
VGCGITWSLLILTVAALAATSYGTASCRLVVVTFASVGKYSFEEHFAPDHTTVSDQVHELKNAIGLFHWLRPVMQMPSSSEQTDNSGTTATSNYYYDWTKGACAGYQQSMLDVLLADDNRDSLYFTIGRILAITALLLCCGLVLWVWSTACLALTNRFQGCLLLGLALVGAVCTAGAVGCALRSPMCAADSDLFARPPSCSIDQGGLVLLGASLLWLSTAMIAACYILPAIPTGADDDDEWREQQATPPHGGRFSSQRQRMPREIRIIADTTTTRPSFQKSPSTAEIILRAEKALERFRAHSKRLLQQRSSSNNNSSNNNNMNSRSRNNNRTTNHSDDSSQGPQVITTTVDTDSDGHDATEVYIADRLDRIEQLADV